MERCTTRATQLDRLATDEGCQVLEEFGFLGPPQRTSGNRTAVEDLLRCLTTYSDRMLPDVSGRGYAIGSGALLSCIASRSSFQ